MITTSGPYSKDIIKTTEPSAIMVHLMNDYIHLTFQQLYYLLWWLLLVELSARTLLKQLSLQ